MSNFIPGEDPPQVHKSNKPQDIASKPEIDLSLECIAYALGANLSIDEVFTVVDLLLSTAYEKQRMEGKGKG